MKAELSVKNKMQIQALESENEQLKLQFEDVEKLLKQREDDFKSL